MTFWRLTREQQQFANRTLAAHLHISLTELNGLKWSVEHLTSSETGEVLVLVVDLGADAAPSLISRCKNLIGHHIIFIDPDVLAPSSLCLDERAGHDPLPTQHQSNSLCGGRG